LLILRRREARLLFHSLLYHFFRPQSRYFTGFLDLFSGSLVDSSRSTTFKFQTRVGYAAEAM
jgi:hypothetical protein